METTRDCWDKVMAQTPVVGLGFPKTHNQVLHGLDTRDYTHIITEERRKDLTARKTSDSPSSVNADLFVFIGFDNIQEFPHRCFDPGLESNGPNLNIQAKSLSIVGNVV